MITLKVKLHVSAGLERDVFASCGAIVRAQLQDQVEATVREAVRDHGASVPLRIALNLGNLSWATWKSDFVSLSLSALRRRSFTVEVADRTGPMSQAVPYRPFAHTPAISSMPAETDHRRAFENQAPEERAVPRDGMVALSAYLEKGHFSATPPWGSAAPGDWFAGELGRNARHVVDVLTHAVKQPLRYSRLRHAVGASLAAQALSLCDGALCSGALCDSAEGPPVDFEGGLANLMDLQPSEAGRSMKRVPVNGDVVSSDRCDVIPPEFRAVPHRSEQDVIVVTNAGLICLWPLIPAFLAAIDVRPSATSAAELSQAEAADDAQIRVSAAIALDYLVWGDPEWREWRMPINKRVCGLPQDALIDAPMLDDDRKAKIDAWLHALPSRVPGLGTCGVSDVRQLFLQRGGKLVSGNGRWRIEVEADVCDVLLEPLPWPLQQAVLPWLPEPIEVLWR